MSCADCVTNILGSVDFFKKLYPNGEEHPHALPVSGTMELTLRCNVRCKHCYILYPGATDNEMTTDQVKFVLKKLADNGVVFLLLTGGEIFTRPDFKEIYLFAKECGLILSLYTNATLIDEAVIELLTEYPPRTIEVTIYGHTEETYEAVTGVKGSFKRFRRGVQLMIDADLPVALKTVALKTNVHEFYDIKKWVVDQGLEFRYDAGMHPKLDHDESPLNERISPQKMVELEKSEYANAQEKYLKKIHEVMGYQPKKDMFVCGMGIRTFHVDPRGNLHSCMIWRQNPYNLLERELDENWRKHVTAIREQKNEDGPCTACSNRPTCGRCPAQSFLEMKDPTKNIPWHCEVSQERKKVYGEPQPLSIEII